MRKPENKINYSDDLSVPNETLIYFSKSGAILSVLLAVVAIVGLIYFFEHNETYAGVFLGLTGVFLAYTGIKQFKNRSPQITLSARGIKTAHTPLYSWSSIRNDRVQVELSNWYSRYI